MPQSSFATKRAAATADAIAPDGSEVRVLCAVPRGSMAVFALQPGHIAKAVAHRTMEELWYVTQGQGRIWRKAGKRAEVVELAPGVSVSIPTGAHFQFRNDGGEVLEIVAVTMPPWPGEQEAYPVEGPWPASL